MPALPFVRRPKPQPTLSPVQTCSSSSAPRLRGAYASNCAALRAVEGRRGGGQPWVGGIGVEAEVCGADIDSGEDDDAVFALSRYAYSKEDLEISCGGGVGDMDKSGEWLARLPVAPVVGEKRREVLEVGAKEVLEADSRRGPTRRKPVEYERCNIRLVCLLILYM